MASRKLTQKQETRRALFIECGSQIKPYRTADDAGRMDRNTGKKRARDAFQLPHIQARIAELRDALAEQVRVNKSWGAGRTR